MSSSRWDYPISSRDVYTAPYSSSPKTVQFSDYLINEPKLKPRLAAIYDVAEQKLHCTWTNGHYLVVVDKEDPGNLNEVRLEKSKMVMQVAYIC